MPSTDVRDVLLRAMFEPDYHAQLTATPERALHGYNLTDDERAALTKPSPELYRFLQPVEDLGPIRMAGDQPPPTTVVVIIVVAIVASELHQSVTLFIPAINVRAVGDEQLLEAMDDVNYLKALTEAPST